MIIFLEGVISLVDYIEIVLIKYVDKLVYIVFG